MGGFDTPLRCTAVTHRRETPQSYTFGSEPKRPEHARAPMPQLPWALARPTQPEQEIPS
ncbi:hypothetical protein ANT2_1714 [plant metagenome]|uniref:Uncharacterized protein n=1 Tax=plant metagenome TaxID=1297885 RepID=A0A484S7A2_9ZZZZ